MVVSSEFCVDQLLGLKDKQLNHYEGIILRQNTVSQQQSFKLLKQRVEYKC